MSVLPKINGFNYFLWSGSWFPLLVYLAYRFREGSLGSGLLVLAMACGWLYVTVCRFNALRIDLRWALMFCAMTGFLICLLIVYQDHIGRVVLAALAIHLPLMISPPRKAD